MTDPTDHHLARREPLLTGHERPLPDFGIGCGRCGESLAGAPGDACPHCGEPFELEAMFPSGSWVDIVHHIPPRLHPIAKNLLYAAQVPYLLNINAYARAIGGTGAGPIAYTGLRVPREFVYDALYTLTGANRPPAEYAMSEWRCPACREHVPAGFELCWNCEAPHPEEGSDHQDAM